ncbi:hypothetical protein BLNAU_20346 [Blattamonas nauphoetae]|uniref:Uncharacterized protein n=1 Tax=Blattamonas nauphoetae TaxID=2049346 RepID=A0ABQ9X342_9EUKA|nr:hypothetical protein BLNAU_20346 [Blattamonas nauphoetae]
MAKIIATTLKANNTHLMSSPPVKTSQPLPHVDGADLVQQTNTIHGSGLFLEAVHFQLGTGPLFDFGLASSHPTTTNPSTTSLTHSSLSNVTSPTSTNKARLFPQSSQILVSCAVEGSTNHFSGTGTADINTCGSFMSHNSSFERCTTDLAESDQHPIYTLLHRTGTSGLVIPPDVPAESPEIQVTRCTFKTMSGSAPGPAVYTLNSLGKTTIHECSFYLCRGTGSGGAVFLQAKSLTHPIRADHTLLNEYGDFKILPIGEEPTGVYNLLHIIDSTRDSSFDGADGDHLLWVSSNSAF